jgi:xanthine dehydrogenase accessory factor
VVGDGLLAAAFVDMGAFLGWAVTVAKSVAPAVAAIQTLTRADAVLVLSHDHEVGGPVLQAALSAQAGYVGALGSRHTQQARAEWLSQREVPQPRIDAIHGPAGLDVGARTPRRSPSPSPPRSSR